MAQPRTNYRLVFDSLHPHLGTKRGKTRYYTDKDKLNSDYHNYKAFFYLKGYSREGIRGKWTPIALPFSETLDYT